MLLLIDNYDSFSYNLYQLIGEFEQDIKVVRNDEMTVEQIRELSPEKIIISPGPGRPEDAGIICEAARTICLDIPTLGVCLGHQAIVHAFGGTVTYAKQIMHGKQSKIKFDPNSVLFKGVGGNNETLVARYHSLAADKNKMPSCLKITATTSDGEVMAVEHKTRKIFGVQFHPESILTPEGKTMLKNFIEL